MTRLEGAFDFEFITEQWIYIVKGSRSSLFELITLSLRTFDRIKRFHAQIPTFEISYRLPLLKLRIVKSFQLIADEPLKITAPVHCHKFSKQTSESSEKIPLSLLKFVNLYSLSKCICFILITIRVAIVSYDTWHTWSLRSGMGLDKQLFRLRRGGGTGAGGCIACFGGSGGLTLPSSTRYESWAIKTMLH